jgi:hypothetical protein
MAAGKAMPDIFPFRELSFELPEKFIANNYFN